MRFNENLPLILKNWLSKDNLAIFLFHGVIKKQKDPVRNYTGKHIEVDLFTSCLKSLKKVGYPISMEEVLYIVTNQYSDLIETNSFDEFKLIEKFEGFNYSQGKKVEIKFFEN